MTDDLIESHLWLVRHVVYQVAGGMPAWIDRDELAAAGALGLVDAAARFDPTLGVEFKGYAAVRIRGAILDAIRRDDWAPRSVRSDARHVARVEQRLADGHARRPTEAEVAVGAGLSTDRLARVRAREAQATLMYLDFAVDGDDEVTAGELLVDPGQPDPADVAERAELVSYLGDAVALLPAKHRGVIVGLFAEGAKQRDLSVRAGVTPARVSQLRREALVMLRDGILAQHRDGPTVPPVGRVERRRADYAAAIGAARPWRDRLVI